MAGRLGQFAALRRQRGAQKLQDALALHGQAQSRIAQYIDRKLQEDFVKSQQKTASRKKQQRGVLVGGLALGGAAAGAALLGPALAGAGAGAAEVGALTAGGSAAAGGMTLPAAAGGVALPMASFGIPAAAGGMGALTGGLIGAGIGGSIGSQVGSMFASGQGELDIGGTIARLGYGINQIGEANARKTIVPDMLVAGLGPDEQQSEAESVLRADPQTPEQAQLFADDIRAFNAKWGSWMDSRAGEQPKTPQQASLQQARGGGG